MPLPLGSSLSLERLFGNTRVQDVGSEEREAHFETTWASEYPQYPRNEGHGPEIYIGHLYVRKGFVTREKDGS